MVTGWGVVYFDQRTGAPHAVCWSKSIFYRINNFLRDFLRYFDQRMTCRAPVPWSKYTTCIHTYLMGILYHIFDKV